MDPATIQRIQNSLSSLLSECKIKPSDNESEEDDVPASLRNLPTFSLLKDLGDKQEEILKLENDLSLKPVLKSFEEVRAVARDGVELSERIVACLEFMHKYSQILQQALTDPLAEDSLPLPHHLHSKAIQTIDDCVWMIKHRGWQPMGYEVDWESLLLKLQMEVASLMTSTKKSGKYLKELEDLKQKLDLVLNERSLYQLEKCI